MKVHTFLKFTKFFYLMLFCFCGIPPGYSIAFSCHIISGSLWLRHSLRFSLFFFFFLRTLTILRSIGQIFCRIPLQQDLKYVFLMIQPSLRVLWPRPPSLSAISSHIKGTYYQHNLSLLMSILITWQRLSLKLLHWKLRPLSILFSILYSLERNHNAQPLCAPSLKVEHLHKLFGDILHVTFNYSPNLLFSYVFIFY